MRAAWAQHYIFFISHTFNHACALKIDDVKPTVQISCVRTRRVHDSLQAHTCMSGMHKPNLNYTCMQIVSQGQWNKFYEHVHVLRCNSPRQDVNPTKEFLTVMLKQLEGVSFTVV